MKKIALTNGALLVVLSIGLLMVRLGLGDDAMSVESRAWFVRDLWIFGVGILVGIVVLIFTIRRL